MLRPDHVHALVPPAVAEPSPADWPELTAPPAGARGGAGRVEAPARPQTETVSAVREPERQIALGQRARGVVVLVQHQVGLGEEVIGRAAQVDRVETRRGDRVTVQVEKSIASVLLYLGVLKAGAVYLPLNAAYTPAEVDYFIRDAEPRERDEVVGDLLPHTR